MTPLLKEFVAENWYLFIGLLIVVLLLFSDLARRRGGGGVVPVGPGEATRLINRDAVVLDVSSSADYEASHIPGALGIPEKELAEQMARIEKHKDRELVVYCRNGNQSVRAASSLRRAGFEKVHNLVGGFNAWTKDNLPVERA
ncbi:MAG: rhodanese-like domain-containing protein [Gammaproteobacteria bacterium]|jgi:rhodanese-related sulfurtransferase|nr:rhodanese-like domain-containing protein [Gammaproteobacteria bacterium]